MTNSNLGNDFKVFRTSQNGPLQMLDFFLYLDQKTSTEAL